jgi:hypothetical protein
MAEKQYTAKQLRLTNEEILEKFAVYWAEVDSVARRQQSADRIMENIMARQGKTETNHESRIAELEKSFKILCMVLSAACITTIILLWIF